MLIFLFFACVRSWIALKSFFAAHIFLEYSFPASTALSVAFFMRIHFYSANPIRTFSYLKNPTGIFKIHPSSRMPINYSSRNISIFMGSGPAKIFLALSYSSFEIQSANSCILHILDELLYYVRISFNWIFPIWYAMSYSL